MRWRRSGASSSTRCRSRPTSRSCRTATPSCAPCRSRRASARSTCLRSSRAVDRRRRPRRSPWAWRARSQSGSAARSRLAGGTRAPCPGGTSSSAVRPPSLSRSSLLSRTSLLLVHKLTRLLSLAPFLVHSQAHRAGSARRRAQEDGPRQGAQDADLGQALRRASAQQSVGVVVETGARRCNSLDLVSLSATSLRERAQREQGERDAQAFDDEAGLERQGYC